MPTTMPDTPPAGPRADADTTSDTTAGPTTDVPVDTVEGDDEVIADLEFEAGRPADEGHGPAPGIVVFDVGEVLIDETRVWATWAEIVGTSSLTLAAALGAAVVQGLDFPDAFDHVVPNIRWQDFVAEFERRYGGFRDQDLYTDVRPCLQELVDAGVRVIIAGNQPAHRREQLQALDLPHHGMAMSEQLGHDKPDPAFFAAVVELAGAARPQDLLYVGDRVDNDVLPAGAAGLATCWLRRGPWGVLQDLPDDAHADLVLDGLGELPLLLAEWGEPQDS